VAAQTNQTDDLWQVLQRLAADALRQAGPHVRCEIDAPRGVEAPAGTQPVIQALLRQSLSQLDDAGEITVTAVPFGDHVEVEIADSGPPVERRPRTVPMVLALHGATARWQNCPQEGVAVTVCLPCKRSRREAA
jgi:hypothetical protein